MIVEKRPIDITDNTKLSVVALVKALQIVLAHPEKEKPELRAITRVEAHITFPRVTFLTDRTTIRTTAANTPIVCNWATSIVFVLDTGKILRVYTISKIVYLKYTKPTSLLAADIFADNKLQAAKIWGRSW